MQLNDIERSIAVRLSESRGLGDKSPEEVMRIAQRRTRMEDAMETSVVVIEVISEYIGRMGLKPEAVLVERERLAAFLHWVWFPTPELNPTEVLAAMAQPTVEALASAVQGALWAQIAEMEVIRRATGKRYSVDFRMGGDFRKTESQ